MNLMLGAIFVAVVLGMLLRKHEQSWRIMVALLSVAVTTLYFVLANRLM